MGKIEKEIIREGDMKGKKVLMNDGSVVGEEEIAGCGRLRHGRGEMRL